MAPTNVFTGSNGTLTLAEADTTEGQDAKAIMAAYEPLRTVGLVNNVEICVQTDLEEFHAIGQRHATSLHPGDIHISGKIGRAYINGALLFLLQGRGANSTKKNEPYVQPTFNLTVTLTDPAFPGNEATLELQSVKFQSWAYSLPEEDFVMENITFKALTIGVVDKGAASGGQPVAVAPFPE
jgi:hypothetical protein